MFVCAPAAAAAATAVAVLVQQQQQQQTLKPLFRCLLVIVFHNVSMLLSHTLVQPLTTLYSRFVPPPLLLLLLLL